MLYIFKSISKPVTHLPGIIWSKFKATAEHVDKIPNQSVEQVCVKKWKAGISDNAFDNIDLKNHD